MSKEVEELVDDTVHWLAVRTAVECMAQLTPFVVRESMTADEAAKKACDLAEALSVEMLRRVTAAANSEEH